MADKMITGVSPTPEQTKLILEYTQLSIKEKRRPHRTTREELLKLRQKLGMRHAEIIAVAEALTMPKI